MQKLEIRNNPLNTLTNQAAVWDPDDDKGGGCITIVDLKVFQLEFVLI